ncbi:MAG: DUF1934 domain-containing protein [Clostridia bacterium]|nr:DUF1934 domain-containing protein [Clostridia bacterium]
MKIPIDIKIKSERICSDLIHRGGQDLAPETDELFINGFMKKTKDGYRIEFSESDGDTTVIDTFADSTVSLNRGGPGSLHSHMVFADGKAHTCICNTDFMPIQMRVRTKSLVNSLTMQGGKLDIDYTVEIIGNLAERNRLSFSISPDKSIIRS